MFKKFFLLTLRNLWKHKLFSLINICGLAIGISASLIIYLIVNHDFSYNQFKHSERIYRIVTHMHFPEQIFKNPGVPIPLILSVREEATGIEASSPVFSYGGDVKTIFHSTQNPTVFKKQPGIVYVDNNFFKLFPREWLAGNPSALDKPFQVVLSEGRARTYFPVSDLTQALGQVIFYNDSIQATVAGIVKNADQLSDLDFEEFISFSTVQSTGLSNNYGWGQWGSVNSSTQFFVKLSPGAQPHQIEKQIQFLRDKHGGEQYLKTEHFAQPLSDLHFNADYSNFTDRVAHKPTLYGLLLVAAFLLLLACINFINLTTAAAAQRSKEIGIRKTMGSTKSQLIFQFLFETFTLTSLATIVSILFTPALLSVFSDFIPPDLKFNLTHRTDVMFFVATLMLAVTLLSGMYPSFVLARFKPVNVLKNQVLPVGNKAFLRKVLTVVQFVIAQVFIIITLLVAKQIRYTLYKDLGFEKDAIIHIQPPWTADGSKREVLLNKIRQIPEIESVTLGGAPPASPGISVNTMKLNSGTKDIELSSQLKYADSSYFQLYKLRLLAGRYPLPSDTIREYVINETFAKAAGVSDPKQLLGVQIFAGRYPAPIVGVVADFHASSLHTLIKPLAFGAAEVNYNFYHILLKPATEKSSWATAIKEIEILWKEAYPENEFSYAFFDETIAKFYDREQNISKLLAWATILSIFISCLGLLGLVIFTTNQRTREIGIRKVLGASVKQIFSLLSKDFVRLVVVAFAIASPIAWWAIHSWLENFAYRTDVSLSVFLISGILMLVIAFITLSVHTIKTANANPVKSLRTE